MTILLKRQNSPWCLLSLDFMRGLIMVLLTLEVTGFYEYLNIATHSDLIKSPSGSFLITCAMACVSGI